LQLMSVLAKVDDWQFDAFELNEVRDVRLGSRVWCGGVVVGAGCKYSSPMRLWPGYGAHGPAGRSA